MLFQFVRAEVYTRPAVVYNDVIALAFSYFEESGNRIVLSFTVSFILLVTVSYFLALLNYKKKQLQEAYRTENHISKKIHDEIANEIYCALNHLEKTPSLTGPERDNLITRLNSIYDSTRNLSRETGTIDTGTNYKMYLKMMVSGFGCQNVNIIIKGIDTVKWNSISHLKKVTVYRVLQELMVNMKKHSGASIIILEFIHTNKQLVVNYKDNGVGLEKNLIAKNGLLNTENRIESIGGTVIFETSPGNGLHIALSFPAFTPYV
ncbi:MAG: hypothetical protein EOO93_15725 [Pedobacter sp.]|nr:MAG: hypothetical protein EOO93_15725 [Pedobacter sp.]